MRAFVDTRSCLMEFVARELDDPAAEPCGRCASCAGQPLVPTSVDPILVRQAVTLLKRNARVIQPRRLWPTAAIPGRGGRIRPELQNAEGRALCIYGDAGWGQAVTAGKYRDGLFGDDLVQAAVELIRSRWRPAPAPTWVTAIPSLRHQHLVSDFAVRLVKALGLPFSPALEKVHETPEQKTMANTVQQAANIARAFRAVPPAVQAGPLLLLDDIVDSGWTLTLCGVLLREAGSGIVHPFALATAAGTGDAP